MCFFAALHSHMLAKILRSRSPKFTEAPIAAQPAKKGGNARQPMVCGGH